MYLVVQAFNPETSVFSKSPLPSRCDTSMDDPRALYYPMYKMGNKEELDFELGDYIDLLLAPDANGALRVLDGDNSYDLLCIRRGKYRGNRLLTNDTELWDLSEATNATKTITLFDRA